MYAASEASDETLAFLLSKGASPDVMDYDNHATALVAAIQTKCSSTINLLAPMTKRGLDKAVRYLAIHNTDITPSIEDLLRRTASNKETARQGVVAASQWGATKILKILTQGCDKSTLN